MGLNRITARIEVTYPADDARTLEELTERAPVDVTLALGQYEDGPRLASYSLMNAAVDPDPEPTLPPVDPGDQTGSTTP